MTFGKIFGAALAAPLFCASTAWAQQQDCSLKQIASLPMTTTASGKIAVPVKIEGRDVLMAVELGAGTTGINANLIDQLGLDTTPIRAAEAIAGLGGWGASPGNIKFIYQDDVFTRGISTVLQREVSLPEFQVGALSFKNYGMFAMPAWTDPNGIVGVLGTAMLSHMDVELDFQKERMNLFVPTQCPPVYWSNAFAVLPLSLNGLTGEAASPLTLDGKEFLAAFSTDPGYGEMSLFIATNELGISTSDPNLKQVGIKANSDDLKIYRYPFQSLSFGGLSIQDPKIDLITDRPATDPADCADIKFRGGWFSGSDQQNGAKAMCATDMVIRLEELRKLHLYFAFGENKLYVTAADAHK